MGAPLSTGTTTEQKPTEQKPTEQKTTEEIPTEEIPTEEIPTEEIPTEDKTSKLKTTEEKSETMPSINEESVDPATGLTVKEKAAIVESWQHVLPNQKVLSMAFFEKLFLTYPEYIEYFPKFRGKPFSEIKEMTTFVFHAKSVFAALTSIVNNLDKSDVLVSLLVKTGKDHHMRGVPVEAFHNLTMVFMAFMEEKLGSKYTPLAASSWEKALAVMVNVCRTGMVDE